MISTSVQLQPFDFFYLALPSAIDSKLLWTRLLLVTSYHSITADELEGF